MLEVANTYDPAIPLTENDAYINKVKDIMGAWREDLQRQMTEIRQSE